MSVAFTPDVAGAPEITVEPDLVRGPKVSIAGERVMPHRERGRPSYRSRWRRLERPLTLHSQFMGLRARFEGREYEVEARLTLLELFMVVLPLALVTLEPPLGALAAAIGVMTNLLIVRRPAPLPVRVALAAAVVLLGYVTVGLLAGRLLG
jgi:hypothetical protein